MLHSLFMLNHVPSGTEPLLFYKFYNSRLENQYAVDQYNAKGRGRSHIRSVRWGSAC